MDTISTAKERARALRGQLPVLPDSPPEPTHREIAESNINAFFDDTPVEVQGKPELPEQVLPYKWIYRAALRDPEMPREMAETIIECVEDSAAVFSGERTGRMWEETAQANLQELARLEALWKETACSELEGMEDRFKETNQ